MSPRLPLLCALLVAAIAGGCRPGADGTPAAGAVVDDRGRALEMDSPPQRIVSLLPSITELLLALEEGDRLVARTRYDRDPRLSDLPSVGGGQTPNLETIGRLSPDLVVGWADEGDRSTTERLRAIGVPVYTARSQSLADLRRHTTNLGILLDAEERAARLLRSIDRRLDEVRSRVSGAGRPSVFYVVWHDPPTTTGSGTFLDSLITVAGGRNAFGDASGRWPQISLEEVLRRDPDVVVLTGRHDGSARDTAWIRERPGWRSLSAVREGEVLVVDADRFNRPGPRVVEAARTLAEFLHPGRFDGGGER